MHGQPNIKIFSKLISRRLNLVGKEYCITYKINFYFIFLLSHLT